MLRIQLASRNLTLLQAQATQMKIPRVENL
jgi:hypothetical protein